MDNVTKNLNINQADKIAGLSRNELIDYLDSNQSSFADIYHSTVNSSYCRVY